MPSWLMALTELSYESFPRSYLQRRQSDLIVKELIENNQYHKADLLTGFHWRYFVSERQYKALESKKQQFVKNGIPFEGNPA